MLAKVKDILNTDLAKVSFLNAISTFIKMLSGFVSVKVVAVLIGRSGIALVGQLYNFTSILLSISTGGINNGMTRYVAEYSDSRRKYTLFIRTGFWITAVLSIASGLTLIIGSKYFAEIILKDVAYRAIFVVFGCTIIFYAFNMFLLAVMNGFKEFKRYVIVNIVSSLTGLIFSILLSIKFGLFGALISAVTFQSVVCIVTVIVLSRTSWFSWDTLIGKFSGVTAMKLGHYSVMELVSAATVPVSQLIVRGYIIKHESIDSAGLWEGMNRISGMYLLIITSSLTVYYLPRLAQLKTRPEIRNEIFSVYRFALPILALLTLMIFLFKGLIIKILFNDKFNGMEHFFGYQLTGDFFRVAGWILSCQLLAKAMTKTYIVTEIVFRALFVGLGITLVNAFGTVGATMGYTVYNFLYFITMVIIFRKTLFLSEQSI